MEGIAIYIVAYEHFAVQMELFALPALQQLPLLKQCDFHFQLVLLDIWLKQWKVLLAFNPDALVPGTLFIAVKAG